MDKELELTKVYHFVAKEEMKNKIIKFSDTIKMNMSKTVRFITETMMPLVDNYTIFEEESSHFGYSEFGSEVDIKFGINPNVYRKLRNVHGAMHSFSIAVLVRKMIELFFKLIEFKSLEWLQNLMNCTSTV